MAKATISKNNQKKKFGNTADIISVTGNGNMVYAMGGKDRITLSKGANNKLFGGADADIITVNSAADTGNKLYGEAGNDTFAVKGGSGNFVYGGVGLDKFTVSGGTGNKIYGDAGNDTFTVKGGSGNSVYGGVGLDKFTISGGTDNKIYGDAGNDTFNVKGGENNSLYGGAGTDKFTVSKGSGYNIYGDAGNDTITVNGGNDHTLSGGKGSDKYVVGMSIGADTRLTIDQTQYAKKDADTLQLSKVSKNDVTYGLLNGTLTIKHKSGGFIVIDGWDKNPISQITFKDKKTVKKNTITKDGKKNAVTAVTWDAGGIVEVDAKTVVSSLQVTGHNGADFVAALSNGQMVLQDASGGMLTIKNWNNNTISQFVFIAPGGAITTFTADQFNSRLGTVSNVTGSEQTVYGTDSNDKFTVSGEYNIVFGKAGNDIMEVSSGSSDELYGDEGNDIMTIRSGQYNDLYGGDGNDRLEVISNTYGSLVGGPGDDTYIVHWPLQAYEWGNNISIDHGKSLEFDWVGAANGDKDSLIIKGAKRNDVNIYLDRTYESMLVIEDATATDKDKANKITVSDWFMHGFDAVYFDDATMTAADLSATLSGYNELTPEYYDGSETAVFTFTGKGWAATLANTSSANRVDLSNYNEGTSAYDGYGYGEAFRTGNDLMIGFERKGNVDEAGLIGTVTVQDYFTMAEADRMSSVLWHNSGTDADEALHVMAGDGNMNMAGTDDKDVIFTGSGTKTVDAFDGDDTIVVGWSSKYDKHYATGNQVINAGDGNDKIIAGLFSDGGAHTLNGGAGNDNFTVVQAGMDYKDMTLNGGDGDDNMEVVGTGHTLNGDAGDDMLKIEGNNNKLYGGTGKDDMNISGKDNVAWGGADDDCLMAFFGTNNTLYGEDGDDVVEAMHSNSNKLYGGVGDDTITVGGKYNEAYGESGNDVIRVVSTGSDRDHICTANTMRGGLGSDNYEVGVMNSNGWTLTIDQQDFAAGDKDTLKLEEYNRDDAVYTFNNNVLSISLTDPYGSGNKGTISVTGWTVNPFDKVVFADGKEMTSADINSKFGLG